MSAELQLRSYKSPRVRDLVWVLLGPNLLKDQSWILSQEMSEAWVDRYSVALAELDLNPAPIEEYLSAQLNSPRLGRYFEALLSFWFAKIVKPDIFVSSLPIRDGKITIGEFDLIYQFAHEAIADHWEASVKFYLNLDSTPKASYFLGTETRDRLDLKSKSLECKQLKLGDHPQAKIVLSRMGFSKLRSQAILKGALFYESDGSHSWEKKAAPDEVAETHSRGWWCTQDRLLIPLKQLNQLGFWVKLEKNRWLSPVFAPNNLKDSFWRENELSRRVQHHFSLTGQALMLAELEWDEALQGYCEVSRGLIVRASWREDARAALSAST